MKIIVSSNVKTKTMQNKNKSKNKNKNILYIACPNRDQEKKKNILIKDKKAYYNARFFSLLIDSNDKIMIPDNTSLRKFWEFCCTNIEIDASQAIWTSGTSYVIYDDYMEVIDELESLIKQGYVIIPNSTNDDSIQFMTNDIINMADYILETKEFIDTYKTKKWLHPNINSTNNNDINDNTSTSIFDEIAEYTPGGYICDNIDELVLAYQKLTENNNNNTNTNTYFIKPTDGIGGGGIVKITSLDDIQKYKFTRQVALEEFINVDRYHDGMAVTPSVQYMGSNVLTIIDQLVDGVSYIGSVYPARISDDVKNECMRVCQEVVDFIKPQGYGGFDLVISNNKPYIIDPNTGRFTGAYSAYSFWNKHSDEYFGFISFIFTPKCTLDELWNELKNANIAYDKNQKNPVKNISVFPLVYLDDICQMIVMANSYDDMFSTRQKILDMFSE